MDCYNVALGRTVGKRKTDELEVLSHFELAEKVRIAIDT